MSVVGMKRQRFDYLDDLPDVTPRTAGQEIGDAVAGALVEVGKGNASLSKEMVVALTNAMRDAGAMKAPTPTIRKWVFNVERDKDGLMTRVVAIAG